MFYFQEWGIALFVYGISGSYFWLHCMSQNIQIILNSEIKNILITEELQSSDSMYKLHF